jgi:hypothetical protein
MNFSPYITATERSPRRLHLIDLENLAGGPRFSPVEALSIERTYRSIVGIGPRDLVVVSTSHVAAPASWEAFASARRLMRSGRDGADLELLSVVANERVSTRFSSVVVASGDRIFAEPCAQLQQRGCLVTVASKRCSLSRCLAFAVRDIIYLDSNRASAVRFAA